mmetsp:Transcript_14026/g.43561  ORF Transcript_14026/g.43561 Transcript_14026/m.43561 type:complete len:237 (+) Transcript_14026:188-898(+)
MKLSTSELPNVSEAKKPVKFAEQTFHTLTSPFMSTPKMGAFALSMSLEYSCSCAMRAVMSWPIPTTPMTLPCSSLLVVAFSRISTDLPALVTSGNSKFAVSSPFKAFVKTSCTRSRCSSRIKSLTRFLPFVSSLLNSVTVSAFLFQTLMRPFTLTPKIGAFAVSINLAYSCSCATRAVMSWPMPTTPLMRFCSSLLVVAFSNTSTRTPALVTNGNSKFAVSSQFSAFVKTSWTRSL